MGKLIINKNLVTDEKAEALLKICPFGAITYKNGALDINSACKMCKMCVKKGGGLVDFVEDEVKEEAAQVRSLTETLSAQSFVTRLLSRLSPLLSSPARLIRSLCSSPLRSSSVLRHST